MICRQFAPRFEKKIMKDIQKNVILLYGMLLGVLVAMKNNMLEFLQLKEWKLNYKNF